MTCAFLWYLIKWPNRHKISHLSVALHFQTSWPPGYSSVQSQDRVLLLSRITSSTWAHDPCLQPLFIYTLYSFRLLPFCPQTCSSLFYLKNKTKFLMTYFFSHFFHLKMLNFTWWLRYPLTISCLVKWADCEEPPFSLCLIMS